jgi:hypothetical protein
VEWRPGEEDVSASPTVPSTLYYGERPFQRSSIIHYYSWAMSLLKEQLKLVIPPNVYKGTYSTLDSAQYV